MIDISGWEIVTLAILAVVMFGPEKLPSIARKAGRVVRYLSAVANDAKGQLAAELGPEWDDIKLSDLNPKTFIQRHLLDSSEIAAVRGSLDEAKTAISDASTTISSSGITVGATTTAAASATATAAVTVPFDPEAT